MHKIVKIAVVLASIGFISAAYADGPNLPNSTDTKTSSSSNGSLAQPGAKATNDQVLVGGSNTSSPAAQSTSNQGSSLKQDHGSDEDLD